MSEQPEREGRRSFASAERQRVIDALCEHYAQDRLGIQEFERRLDEANRVATNAELSKLLSDLPSLGDTVPVRRSAGDESGASGLPTRAGRVPARRVPESQTELAIFSGRVRSGSWVPARKIRAVAMMGGVELDFREALFGPGETHVHCAAFMGGVEILVPPGVHVDAGGFAILGGFEEDLTGGGELPPDAPTLKVTGVAFLGGVDIQTRLPGENSRQARRRVRARERAQLERAREDPPGKERKG